MENGTPTPFRPEVFEGSTPSLGTNKKPPTIARGRFKLYNTLKDFPHQEWQGHFNQNSIINDPL